MTTHLEKIEEAIAQTALAAARARVLVGKRMNAHRLYPRDGWSLAEQHVQVDGVDELHIWPVQDAIPGKRPAKERRDLGVRLRVTIRTSETNYGR